MCFAAVCSLSVSVLLLAAVLVGRQDLLRHGMVLMFVLTANDLVSFTFQLPRFHLRGSGHSVCDWRSPERAVDFRWWMVVVTPDAKLAEASESVHRANLLAVHLQVGTFSQDMKFRVCVGAKVSVLGTFTSQKVQTDRSAFGVCWWGSGYDCRHREGVGVVHMDLRSVVHHRALLISSSAHC